LDKTDFDSLDLALRRRLHSRGTRGKLVALVVLGPDVELGEPLPAVGAYSGDDRRGR